MKIVEVVVTAAPLPTYTPGILRHGFTDKTYSGTATGTRVSCGGDSVW